MKKLTLLVAGLLFGAGLVVGGMTDPANVVGFLDIAGDWKPALALVMGGAILVHGTTRLLVLKRRAPVYGEAFPPPAPPRIDGPLLLGSALFGVGWGLSGLCPGPALISAPALPGGTLFLMSLFTGMIIAERWPLGNSGKAREQSAATSTGQDELPTGPA